MPEIFHPYASFGHQTPHADALRGRRVRMPRRGRDPEGARGRLLPHRRRPAVSEPRGRHDPQRRRHGLDVPLRERPRLLPQPLRPDRAPDPRARGAPPALRPLPQQAHRRRERLQPPAARQHRQHQRLQPPRRALHAARGFAPLPGRPRDARDRRGRPLRQARQQRADRASQDRPADRRMVELRRVRARRADHRRQPPRVRQATAG